MALTRRFEVHFKTFFKKNKKKLDPFKIKVSFRCSHLGYRIESFSMFFKKLSFFKLAIDG